MEQRGRERERERPIESKRESNCCHRLGVVSAIGIETDKYRHKGPRKRFREEKEDKITSACHFIFGFPPKD